MIKNDSAAGRKVLGHAGRVTRGGVPPCDHVGEVGSVSAYLDMNACVDIIRAVILIVKPGRSHASCPALRYLNHLTLNSARRPQSRRLCLILEVVRIETF